MRMNAHNPRARALARDNVVNNRERRAAHDLVCAQVRVERECAPRCPSLRVEFIVGSGAAKNLGAGGQQIK